MVVLVVVVALRVGREESKGDIYFYLLEPSLVEAEDKRARLMVGICNSLCRYLPPQPAWAGPCYAMYNWENAEIGLPFLRCIDVLPVDNLSFRLSSLSPVSRSMLLVWRPVIRSIICPLGSVCRTLH